MSANRVAADVFTAINGWVTEVHELNWPQDAAIDLDNMELGNKGQSRRRLGIQKEAGSVAIPLAPAAQPNDATSSYLWQDVNNDPKDDVVVVQQGLKLHFFGNVYPLTSQYRGEINLAPYIVETDPTSPYYARVTPCSVARCDRYLFVANIGMSPLRIEMVLGVPVATPVLLEMRMYERFSEYAPNTRPPVLTHRHEFDLRNGGWPWRALVSTTIDGAGVLNADPVAYTYSYMSLFPATADVFNYLSTTAASDPSALGSFSPWEVAKQSPITDFNVGGKFITPAWYIDTMATLTGSLPPAAGTIVPGPSVLRSTRRRPSAVGALNGHVVWASEDYNQTSCLFISQQLSSADKAGRCYQSADPTAQEVNDLVDTDGLVLPIPGLGSVLAMVQLGGYLILLTASGVWALSGSGDMVGLTANSVNVMKVSDFGCSSPTSVAVLNSTLFYWGVDGIYAMRMQPEIEVTSLTRRTIQSWFNAIPQARHKGVIGVADSALSRIEWLLPGHPYGENKDKILVFRAETGGFYKHSIDNTVVRLYTPLAPHTSAINSSDTLLDELVTTTGDHITNTAGDYVVVQFSGVLYSGAERRFRYFGRQRSTDYALVGEAADFSFKDFVDEGGTVDAAAYIEFPYRYNQTRMSGMQVPYINCFFKLFRAKETP